MKEELSLEEAMLQWKSKLEERKPDVEKQLLLAANGPQIPYVSDDCPEKLRPLAERLVALQVEMGEYRREDIYSSDMYKIKDISKATGASFRDVISYLVINDNYLNYDVIDARHIISLLSEFDAAYEKYYAKYGAFPMNVLSPEARRYLKNNKNGLNNIEKLQIVLEVYRPELANIEFSEHNYEAMPKSRIVLSEQNIKFINDELGSVAKNGNVDIIFSKRYEAYFKNLCSKLKLAGFSFDRFLSEHTNLTYTMCFKADILSAVKQMVKSYYKRHGTTRGIINNDPYLRYKIETAQNVAGVYSTKELLDLFGIDNDNFENNKNLSLTELKRREKVLFTKLREIYPDMVVKRGFATKHDKLYDELALLCKRFGYAKIDDYLKDGGFSRIVDKKSEESYIYLSERDLKKYGFIDGCNSFEELNKRLSEFGISYVGPYENLGIYRKLAYEGSDSTYKSESVKTFS